MTIAVGESLPIVNLLKFGENGPEAVDLGPILKGRKVVVFGLPGAYTGTCSSAHVPSFMRTRAAMGEKGVDEVICLSVNDSHVMLAWGEATGATEGGINMLADPAAEFTKAIGMNYTAEATGFYDRSLRYSMLVEDGVVTIFNPEPNRGQCELSAGETLLEQL